MLFGITITIERAIKNKQIIDTKVKEKKNKSENFTRSIRQKSNIAIAILETCNELRACTNYFVFDCKQDL